MAARSAPSPFPHTLPVAAVLFAAMTLTMALTGCEEDNNSGVLCNPACQVGYCCYNGQCVVGNQQNACGTTGLACIQCPIGQTCVNGTCGGGACAPGTCAGCCNGTTCMLYTQQTTTMCGTGGNNCTSCGTQQCTNGVCGGSGTCNSTNCAGCCTTTGQCLLYNQQSATQCGSSGNPCATCPGGSCSSGSCLGGSCNSTNCAGCCSGNQCLQIAQQSSSLCGTGGNPCRSCGTSTCSNGVCGGTGNCGNCALGCCSGATCMLYANQGPAACGTNSAICQPCPAPGVCSNGICSGSGTCGPGVCMGCCSGTQCLLYGQQSAAACGTGGAACTQCTGSTPNCQESVGCQGCNALTCTDGCCQSGTYKCLHVNVEQTTAACGKSGNTCTTCNTSNGEKCLDGECMVAWRVLAISAKVTAKGDPDEWDKNTGGSKPDPMAKCTVPGGQSGETASSSDTYDPVWNKELFTDSQVHLQGGLNCEVLDDDGFGFKEHMGNCTFSLSFSSTSQTFDGACGEYVESFKLQLIKN